MAAGRNINLENKSDYLSAKALLSDIFQTNNVVVRDDFDISYYEIRTKLSIIDRELLEDYYFSKMTLQQLAEKYGYSTAWVGKKFRKMLEFFRKEEIKCYFAIGYEITERRNQFLESFTEEKKALEWFHKMAYEMGYISNIGKRKIADLELSLEKKKKLFHQRYYLVEDLYNCDIEEVLKNAAIHIADLVENLSEEEQIEVEELELSVRVKNALIRQNILTLYDVLNITEQDVLKLRNIGVCGCNEIKQCLKMRGYTLKQD